jgi:IstB-like ATP binding protein
VLFLTLETLITRLRRVQAENRLEWQLQQWIAPKLLIADELGYLPMSARKPTCSSAWWHAVTSGFPAPPDRSFGLPIIAPYKC